MNQLPTINYEGPKAKTHWRLNTTTKMKWLWAKKCLNT